MDYTKPTFFSRKKKAAVRAGKSGFFAKLFPGFSKIRQYNNLQSTRSSKSSYYKPSQMRRKSSFDKKSEDYKVFKPTNENLIKEKSKININFKTVKKFTFGHKNLSQIVRNNGLFNVSNWFKNINFLIVKWKVFEKFNRIVAGLVLVSSILGLFYLSFFDRFFLVKTYSISFSDLSHLDQSQIDQLTKNIREKKLFGILPNNSYWFINDYNLSDIARQTIPEVESVRVLDRTWPNKVELEINTEPILLTLAVTENLQKKYWRISQTGKVLSEDNLNLRENLVEVEKIISFDKPGSSLKNYKLEENTQQLNRFWFVIWLWSLLDDLKIEISKTSFPTLLDTDVEITTKNGTRLLFDSINISKENQQKRIKSVLATVVGGKSIQEKLDNKLLDYIDFRISKKVFVCETGRQCSNNQ